MVKEPEAVKDLVRCPYKTCQAYDSFKKLARNTFQCSMCGTKITLPGG